MEATNKAYYRDGCRTPGCNPITSMRLDAITADEVERLAFGSSLSTANVPCEPCVACFTRRKKGRRVADSQRSQVQADEGNTVEPCGLKAPRKRSSCRLPTSRTTSGAGGF